jgi:hypothetical protein
VVKIKHFLISLLIVIVGIGALVFFFPSEEKRVKKQFALLAERISKDSGENAFVMAQKVKNIGALFAESCDLKEPVHSLSGSYTREEITSIALRGRAYFLNLSLKFYDLNISFPEKEEARVNLTAKLTGKTTSGEYIDEIHELVSILKKIEKKWLFSQFEVVEVLKK